MSMIAIAVYESLLVVRERGVADAVRHDAARALIAGRAFAIISPSRNLAVSHDDLSHVDRRLMHRLRAQHPEYDRIYKEHTAGAHPDDRVRLHNAWNGLRNERMTGLLEGTGMPYVRAVGGYREAGKPVPVGHIPTEGSFVVHHSNVPGVLDHFLNMGREFGQDSIIYAGHETQGKPVLYGLKYHQDGRPAPGFEHWETDWSSDRVRAVHPALANAAAINQKTVAFTHEWTPHPDHPFHHAPPPHLHKIAWSFVKDSAPHSTVLDVHH